MVRVLLLKLFVITGLLSDCIWRSSICALVGFFQERSLWESSIEKTISFS